MRDRIIVVAEKRFFQFGLRKVKMDEIASDLGISKKTLYKHFDGKDRLAAEVMQRFREGIVRLLGELKRTVPDPIERFEKGIAAVSGRLTEIGTVFLTDVKRDIPELWQEIEDFREREILSYMRDMLEEGKKSGRVNGNINTRIATLAYLGAVRTIIQPDVIGKGEFSIEEAFDNIRRIFVEGIRAKR